MEIKTGMPSAILTAATTMLQQYVPDLTPKSLVSALKVYVPGETLQLHTNAPEKPYTRKEVCSLLGISLMTLHRLMKDGVLRKINISKNIVRIDPASVRNLLEKVNTSINSDSEQLKGV